MAIFLHQEIAVTVTSIIPYGLNVVTQDGDPGFIDNLKIPTTKSDEANLPEIGSSLLVVVLDDSRTPFRGSLMQYDFLRARELRMRGR